ncbi:MAG: hypothetical protein WCB90_02500 [Methanosarcina sp.]
MWENIEEVWILEVAGLCAICGHPAKLYTCQLCGKSVCNQCMDLKKGICIRCASGRAVHPLRDSEEAGILR